MYCFPDTSKVCLDKIFEIDSATFHDNIFYIFTYHQARLTDVSRDFLSNHSGKWPL